MRVVCVPCLISSDLIFDSGVQKVFNLKRLLSEGTVGTQENKLQRNLVFQGSI